MTTETTMLGIFEDYLTTMENFLTSQSETIRNKKDKYLQEEHGTSLAEFEKMDFVNHMLLYYNSDLASNPDYSGQRDYDEYFPRILRQSFFISLYSYCEDILNSHCYELQRMRNFTLSLKDLSGSGIIRAKNYLVKVAGVKFPNDKEWQEIQTYGKLRNCFVHNSGEISGLSESDAKFLKQYASKHRHLEVQEFPPITVIEIKKGFCEEAIKVIDSFSVKLIRSCGKQEFAS